MSGIAASRYEGEGFPQELGELKLTFEGVAAAPRVVDLERTNGAGVEGALARLLDLAEVDYVDVRNTEAGCFVARVDRERSQSDEGGAAR